MPRIVSLDRNRVTRVDGRPFFLIGARHMPEGASPETLRNAGFNAFRALAFGHEAAEPEVIPRDLEGIYFWSYLYDRADFSKSADYELQLGKAIAELKGHPALLCYENLNEPTMLYKSDRFKAQPENLARGAGMIRKLDPNHPIWLAHTCGNTIETLRRFNPSLDIVGCNPYPVQAQGMRRHVGVRQDGRMLDCIDQSVHAVGRYTDKMMSVAEGRPVWMLIQAMANENWFSPIHTPELAAHGIDESKVLYPTFEQMRFMAFDAIASGATGLAFSMWRTPSSGPIWDDITRVAGELRALHDALSAPPLPGEILVSHEDLGFSIWDGVRVLARRLGNDIYAFAVNTAFDPAQVTIRLPVNGCRAALVVGEDREIAMAGNAITDRFDPYGVHVYKCRL